MGWLVHVRPLALASAILLVACGPRPPAPGAESSPSVIPWIPTQAGPAPTPSPTPLPTPLAMRFCQSNDLSLRVGRTGVGLGTAYTTLVFTNRGSTPCQLQGVPIAHLLDAGGQPVATSGEPLAWGDGSPVALSPGITDGGGTSPPVAGQAQLIVAIASVLCTSRPSTSLDLALPNQAGRMVAPWSRTAYTGGDCGGSSIQVTAFLNATGASGAPEPVPVFTVQLDLPASAPIGQTLRYRVRLTNVSGHAITFATCPGYTEFIKGPTAFLGARYVLNCKPLGVFKPDATATFAMELPLVATGFPHQLAAGANPLRWFLDWPYQTKTLGTPQIVLTGSSQ